ncbi:Protein-tyrosine sulfotransferase [Camponotus floridanus]|uniref:Protein-tyrosine sulfotransferase n=1 Tax=Camponotus floridanus TaxID=104421 RepID=E2A5I9_CAMFO|nr:Protein-tyrosine sulfotransferase [Camponotus floridanus]
MLFLSSRSSRKGPIACLVGLLLLFALYQLGIICGSTRYMPTAVMVSKEVRTRDQSHPADSPDEDALVEIREGECATYRGGNLERKVFWDIKTVALLQVIDSAIAAFCLEIIARHAEPAPRLCNKDPLTLKMGSYILELFPNAKFIFMVRDGRATVHSIISRKVTITGFDLSSYRQSLIRWNHAISVMYGQCKELGPERCLMVPYEQLVLHPRQWMKKILNYLDVPWNESVMHHEEFINKPGGVPLSKVERSSDQIIKPVNLAALTKWVGNIPEDVVREMADIAPMLSVLGYDPYANPPVYGAPDSLVSDNTRRVLAGEKLWEEKARAFHLSHRPTETSNEEAASSTAPVA